MSTKTFLIRMLFFPILVSLTVAQERESRQINLKGAPIADQNSAETGFGGGGGGGIENSKYFHYQHLPEHDKYEFGFRRGNDHHVKERYEKAVPHEGHFKTKVRWADHHGGQGEHYWDYNHAGHGGDDGEGGYSDPVPTYVDNNKITQKRQSEVTVDPEREEYNANIQTAALLASPSAFQPAIQRSPNQGFVGSFEEEIGKIQGLEIQREKPVGEIKYKRNPTPQPQPQQQKSLKPQTQQSPQLFFDLETGTVIDELTGKTYILKLVDK